MPSNAMHSDSLTAIFLQISDSSNVDVAFSLHIRCKGNPGMKNLTPILQTRNLNLRKEERFPHRYQPEKEPHRQVVGRCSYSQPPDLSLSPVSGPWPLSGMQYLFTFPEETYCGIKR
jgi:hypothetical protein